MPDSNALPATVWAVVETRWRLSRQTIIITALVALAFGALLLGVLYQGDRTIEQPSVVGALDDETTSTTVSDVPGGRLVDEEGNLVVPAENGEPLNPIESFLPASSAGANCLEPVGVDLIAGYAASLVINGERIPPEDMNGADPETGALPASRTQGRYTFGPEQGCPNGEILRPLNNVLQACVYPVDEGPENCVISEFRFDAL